MAKDPFYLIRELFENQRGVTVAKRTTLDKFSLVQEGERILRSGGGYIGINQLTNLVISLINLYNNIFEDNQLRQRAAKITARLAKVNIPVLEFIFEDARKYAREQHIDDAFPYSPNSFEALALVGPIVPVVIFLEEGVKIDWGISRWAAIEELCALRDPAANKILQKIVFGSYPPKNFSREDDLRIIEKYKRKVFAELVRAGLV